MNSRLLAAILILFACQVFGQHLPLYSAQNDQIGVINPAALNHDQMMNGFNMTFGGSFRRQWLQMENGPVTQFVRGDYMFHDGDALGFVFGGHLINDQTGPTGFSGGYGRIGVILGDPEYGGVSAGLHGGLVQYRINVSDIELRDKNDVLVGNDQAQLYPDVGAGVFAWKRMESGFLDDCMIYGGVSIPQVLGLDLAFQTTEGEFGLRRVQHFYGTAGIYKPLSNDRYLRISNWTMYAPGAKVRSDLDIRFLFTENFWIGTGASTNGSFHLETGFISFPGGSYDRQFRFGYMYDYAFSNIGPDAGSSHQIQMVYALDY